LVALGTTVALSARRVGEAGTIVVGMTVLVGATVSVGLIGTFVSAIVLVGLIAMLVGSTVGVTGVSLGCGRLVLVNEGVAVITRVMTAGD
jgi:hypothetical protein